MCDFGEGSKFIFRTSELTQLKETLTILGTSIHYPPLRPPSRKQYRCSTTPVLVPFAPRPLPSHSTLRPPTRIPPRQFHPDLPSSHATPLPHAYLRGLLDHRLHRRNIRLLRLHGHANKFLPRRHRPQNRYPPSQRCGGEFRTLGYHGLDLRDECGG